MAPTDFENSLSRIRLSDATTPLPSIAPQCARCSQTAVQTKSCHDAAPT
jgi:hypothetical protein